MPRHISDIIYGGVSTSLQGNSTSKRVDEWQESGISWAGLRNAGGAHPYCRGAVVVLATAIVMCNPRVRELSGLAINGANDHEHR